LGGLGQRLSRGNLHVDETGKRKVDICDLFEVDVFTNARELLNFGFRQNLRHGLTKSTPSVTVEIKVGAYIGVPRHGLHCVTMQGYEEINPHHRLPPEN